MDAWVGRVWLYGSMGGCMGVGVWAYVFMGVWVYEWLSGANILVPQG